MAQRNAQARSERPADNSVVILNPLVREITQALIELGGAAHRDVVVAHIAKKCGVFRPSPAMAQDLDLAFSTYCSGACDPGALSLLHLPNGPSSRRWALTDQAHGLLGDGLDATVR